MANLRETFENAKPEKNTVHFVYTSKTGLFWSDNTQSCDYTFRIIRTPKNVRIKITPPDDINYQGWLGAVANLATLGLVQRGIEDAADWLNGGIPLDGVGSTRTAPIAVPLGMGNDPKTYLNAKFTLEYFSKFGALVSVEIDENYAAAKKDQTVFKQPKMPDTFYVNSGEYVPSTVQHITPVVNPVPYPVNPTPLPTGILQRYYTLPDLLASMKAHNMHPSEAEMLSALAKNNIHATDTQVAQMLAELNPSTTPSPYIPPINTPAPTPTNPYAQYIGNSNPAQNPIATPTTAKAEPAKSNTALYVGLGAAALIAVMMMNKNK